MVDYGIPGAADRRLHHLYRAMAWLGEYFEPSRDGDLAPCCVKDEIEEGLFERRRDLFTDLSLVFMDTTTLLFHGAGGESLGGARPFQGTTALTCVRWCWPWSSTARAARCALRC